MNQLLDQDQDLGFPLGKGQGKKWGGKEEKSGKEEVECKKIQ